MGKALQKLRQRIHPARRCPEIQALLKAHEDSGKGEKLSDPEVAASYVKRCQELKSTPEGKVYDVLTSKIDRLWAPVARLDHGAGRSNRARRAKRAQDVFSKFAGLSKIQGAQVDRDGNAVGVEYDLGMEGAYDGLRVVILHQYTGEGFTGEKPCRALRAKGFQVDHIKGNALLSMAGLDAKLQAASQLWLISSHRRMLSQEQIALIVKHWQQGLGLYIFGDNDPFYVDANRLLHAMDVGLQLKGNYRGKKKRSGSKRTTALVVFASIS